jgi:phosphate-selective porin OprO/OprP
MRRLLALVLLALPLRASAFELAPTLMAQTDYVEHAAEADRDDGFQLQRLRLGLRAAPTSWLTAVGTLEYENSQVSVFEAYVDAVAARSWHFSVGFRRTPLFHTAKDELVGPHHRHARGRLGPRGAREGSLRRRCRESRDAGARTTVSFR